MAKMMAARDLLIQYSDITIVVLVVTILVMMVIPMPPFLLDMMLAANITGGILILLLTMNIAEPLELSVFPSLLLIATLFRLALNVSSTRLILLHGYAGSVIQSFGGFVVGGNYVVGFVVFLILVVIQFIVITRGAERVAEVAARFTLDAMPGKQMSIDADLNAGLIDDAEARQRRRQISREADFYGAMDGASKFVKGDAIAGIVITIINILGGFMIGIGQKGMALDEALQRYTLLTVGDGLVSQIPALLISTATGIIITRSASQTGMGADLTAQLLSRPRVLGVAAVVLGIFGLVPGLPHAPFFVVGGLLGGLAYATHVGLVAEKEEVETEPAEIAGQEEAAATAGVKSLLQIDIIELEVGYALIPLVDSKDMLDRIGMIRRQLAIELGVIVPSIRIRDNMQLSPNDYVIKIKGVAVARGELMVNHYLAMDSGGVTEPIEGISTTEPAFGLPALWIPEERREKAEMTGYTVVDAPSVLATHLTEVLKSHSYELLGRQEVRELLDNVREEYPAVVEELVPDVLGLGEIQKVLQNLLREGVSIRNLLTILETLADYGPVTRDPDVLTEYVRAALARQISVQHAGEGGIIHAITLAPQLDESLAAAGEAAASGESGAGIADILTPRQMQELYEEIARVFQKASQSGVQPVLLTSPAARPVLRRILENALPQVPVLSFREVSSDVEVQAVGTVSLSNES